MTKPDPKHKRPAGRPGAGRAKDGRVRAAILPALKHEAERVAAADPRIRYMSRLVESAIAFFLQAYSRAGGRLNHKGHPVNHKGHPVNHKGPAS